MIPRNPLMEEFSRNNRSHLFHTEMDCIDESLPLWESVPFGLLPIFGIEECRNEGCTLRVGHAPLWHAATDQHGIVKFTWRRGALRV
jgi:hypothetical protein